MLFLADPCSSQRASLIRGHAAEGCTYAAVAVFRTRNTNSGYLAQFGHFGQACGPEQMLRCPAASGSSKRLPAAQTIEARNTNIDRFAHQDAVIASTATTSAANVHGAQRLCASAPDDWMGVQYRWHNLMSTAGMATFELLTRSTRRLLPVSASIALAGMTAARQASALECSRRDRGHESCGRPSGPSRRILLQDRWVSHGRRAGMTVDQIHENPPREVAGRETILRFRMQFQAAAYAALEILSGSDVDRVYCDYHDDFVVRRSSSAGVNYHFFQVKTKAKLNKRWTLLEVFALKKKGALDTDEKLQEIRDSIAGKLFSHTIQFGEQCREVTILSNVHFEDEVLEAIAAVHAGSSTKKYVTQFLDNFEGIFSPGKTLTPAEAQAARVKFNVQAGVHHIGETLESFTSAARTAIWTHSEIDLRPQEVDEIARSLVDVVTNKSCARIAGITKQGLDEATSVGLKDLLEVLSISTPVYETLRAGQDPQAIKSASILQRQLKQAGASDSMIETASRLKVAWDVWLRTNRHVYTEMDLEALLQEVESACTNWLLAGGRLADLRALLSSMRKKALMKVFSTLNDDLLFGAVLAAMVRRGAR